MYPASIEMADWRQKKSSKHNLNRNWRTVSGQHCLLAERDIGAPIFTLANSLVRLAYFHTNRLLTGLYKTETEIRWRKDDNKIKKQTDIDRHGPKPSSNGSQPPNPPFIFINHYSLKSAIFQVYLYKLWDILWNSWGVLYIDWGFSVLLID